MKNYFTDTFLYIKSVKIVLSLHNNCDSGNEADTESEVTTIEDELKPIIISLDRLEDKCTTDDVGSWNDQ